MNIEYLKKHISVLKENYGTTKHTKNRIVSNLIEETKEDINRGEGNLDSPLYYFRNIIRDSESSKRNFKEKIKLLMSLLSHMDIDEYDKKDLIEVISSFKEIFEDLKTIQSDAEEGLKYMKKRNKNTLYYSEIWEQRCSQDMKEVAKTIKENLKPFIESL